MYVARIDDGNIIAVTTISRVDRLSAGWSVITDEQARTVKDGGLWLKGSGLPAWSYDVATSTLSAIPDIRLSGAWSQTTVNLAVGDPPVTVQLTLSASMNASRVLNFGAGSMYLTFVDGVADVVIDTSAPLQANLEKCTDFRLTNALKIRVLDNRVRAT